MSKSHLTLVVVVLLIPACATPPKSAGLSAGRPATIDCRRVAPTGSKAKSKTVCGQMGRGQSIATRKQLEKVRDPRDVMGTRRRPDGSRN